MSELVIPLATKLLLTGALLLLAAVFLWQAWRIWFSQTLVLAPFDFLEAGKPAADAGEQFARMIREELLRVASLYDAGKVPSASAVGSTGPRESAEPMKIPGELKADFFDFVELKAYGIEVGKLFKSLRRQIESPSEITGSVTHQGSSYSVFVELRQAGGPDHPPQRWTVQYAKDLPEATRGAACRIFRFLAGRSTLRDAPLFRAVDDEDFCLFNQALASYEQYRQRKAVLPADDAAKLLAEAHRPIANLVEREVTFPYVHKLAALVFYELKQYRQAEASIELYFNSLGGRTDPSADLLRASITSRKLQTTPAVSRQRPLRPASSIGPLDADRAGMICCIVKDAQNRRYILSAAPVLGSAKGAQIVQPATRDGGGPADVVADLEITTPTFALARIRDKVTSDPEPLELGVFKALEPNPKIGQVVVTYGFDGKRREGKVVAITPSMPVADEATGKSISVANVAITTGILSAGEIGAPVVTPEGRLVGMIFGKGGDTTLVLLVEPALKDLQLELVK